MEIGFTGRAAITYHEDRNEEPEDEVKADKPRQSALTVEDNVATRSKSTQTQYMEAEITKQDYEAQAAFRYALRQFIRRSEIAARSHGLMPQQFQALLAIQGYPGREVVTVGELAERLQLRHHTAVELIDRMEAQKLVTRAQGEVDRRQVRVSLTDAGREAVETVVAENREQLRQFTPELRQLLMSLATAATESSDGKG
jgi:DNA-binding MarR family transcriptional regulator